MVALTSFFPSGVKIAAAAFCTGYDTPLNFVVCLLNQRGYRGFSDPSEVEAKRSFGITVYAHLVPVNPAVFEKLRNSIATFLAPSISYIEWGITGSEIYDSYAES